MTGFPPRFRAPGIGLEGYREAVSPGRRALADHGAAPAATTAAVRVARLIHGDPNSLDSGYRDQPADEIPSSESLVPAGSFSVSLWFHPHSTVPAGAVADMALLTSPEAIASSRRAP